MTEVAASIKLHSVYPWLESFWAQFESQRQQGRLHHALLLSGPDGCGKRDLAFSFVSRLLCDEPAGSSACGACKSCLLLLSGTHPGFLGVFPEDTGAIKIDQIRAAITFSQHTQMKQGARVVMVHPAEAMNKNAANAILKCLEEPQQNMYFVLVSDCPGRLLATVRSRCQLFSIPEPPFEQGLAWLMQFEHDKDKASSLLRLSASRPLLARKYFEEGSDNLYEEMVEGLISLRSRKLLIVELAGKWHKNLAIYDFWFHWLLEDLKAVFNGCTQQTGLSAESIQVFLKKLINAKKQALSTANPNLQLLLEALLVDWLMLPVE